MLDIDQTIVAVGTPNSPSARGMVRVSGPRTVEVLQTLKVMSDVPTRAFRFAGQLDLGEPLGPIELDVMIWPDRRSYTGQPSAELHLLGSPPIIAATLRAVMSAGARLASPGEFTLRAFLAGCIDLTQAEAVLGVIDAEDPRSLEHALSQLAGNLSRPLADCRSTLLDLIADVEAGLDFVDEEIEFITDEALIERLRQVQFKVASTMEQLGNRTTSTDRFRFVLRGRPNAGKSRLLNALVGREAAIVTAIAGTTRDVVRAIITWDGQTIELIDTAGIEARSSDDPEAIVLDLAQQHAADALAGADLIGWCFDLSESADEPLPSFHVRTICIATKIDLVDPTVAAMRFAQSHRVSSLSGEGIEKLRLLLIRLAKAKSTETNSGVIGTAARCHESLSQAAASIEAAVELTQSQSGHELVAGELRHAVRMIGEVTGEVVNDDILDRVFSRFCIGK